MTEEIEITKDILDKLRGSSTATVTTQLFKLGYRQQFLVGVEALNPKAKAFAGEAYTLRFIPSREDKDWDLSDLAKRGEDNMQWEAVEDVGEGQVLMIDSRNDTRAASAGNILIYRMMLRGVAAVVTDGAFRDGHEIGELDIPTYARGNTATTRPAYFRAVDVQLPIGCGDVAVYPGDVVMGDRDGVCVIPRHEAAKVAEMASNQEAAEEFIYEKIKGGAPIWGNFPMGPETRAEFEEWKKTRG
ncbi:ribonuclease activity regulator RraA [Notoacmeibacter sp. MSK16QG-6]|uniref:ribonuclease activity regulator RraA n=1 Tax=Notoacmeibacter sp. MSK16QG-6 TaxID=2957982 RepID=UPI0020A0BA5F|nr:ribonuclease activity regulator RraA [Notoacmeibacter sp. MSK16QG-6]MCP1199580.1 ribonuclease activity regulator RraA [Notoacmeibacter sp. MSK16QG-6]